MAKDRMLKIIGVCMLLFTFTYLSAYLGNVMRRRVEVGREVYDLLRYIRRRVGCYLLPITEIAASYSTPHLEASGFLERIRCAQDPLPSLTGRYKATNGVMRIAEGVFSSLGTGYLEDEVRLLDGAVAELSSVLASDEVECKKRTRLYSVLICAVGVGSLILVL